MPRQWVCSMIGAREHYAVPRALTRMGRLDTLYTDIWAGPLTRRVAVWPSAARAWATRHHADLILDRVVSFPGPTLRERLVGKFGRGHRDIRDRHLQYIAAGKSFADRVNHRLERRHEADRPAGLFGYNTGSLETLELFRDWGRPTVVDQIDAAKTHEDTVVAEEAKWPGWQLASGRIPNEYWQRLSAEWRLADCVVVNSTWSARALALQGVNPDKIVIMPVAYESQVPPRPPRNAVDERVVLFVGRVVLEKGIPYLFEAARLLAGKPIRFVVAGPIGISPESVATAPSNVTLLGPVTRDRVAALYRSADVAVFPTLSDGFGITQLEAMAHGLPVVSTPNCGDVVTDGVDGRVVPAADAVALAGALDSLVFDTKGLAEMSRMAGLTIQRFSLAQLVCRLERIMSDLTPAGAEEIGP